MALAVRSHGALTVSKSRRGGRGALDISVPSLANAFEKSSRTVSAYSPLFRQLLKSLDVVNGFLDVKSTDHMLGYVRHNNFVASKKMIQERPSYFHLLQLAEVRAEIREEF